MYFGGDFDREMALENAGIDPFEFSLMDDDERRDTLRQACLDPEDYENLEFEGSFSAWTDLQNAGLRLDELQYMNREERRLVLEDADLDPDDYESVPYLPVPKRNPTTPAAEKQPAPTGSSAARPAVASASSQPPKQQTFQFCQVQFPGTQHPYTYRVGALNLLLGEIVMVPVSTSTMPKAAKVVDIREYTREKAPLPVDKAKLVLRRASPTEKAEYNHLVEASRPKPVRETPVAAPVRTAKRSTPVLTEPKKRSGLETAARILGAVAIFWIFLKVGCAPSTTPYTRTVPSGRSTYRSTTRSTTGSGSTATRSGSSDGTTKASFGTGSTNAAGSGSDTAKNTQSPSSSGTKSSGGTVFGTNRSGAGTGSSSGTSSGSTMRSSSGNTSKSSGSKSTGDPYHAKDYMHPEDFYEFYYDDFWDYEEAEEYWEKHR